MWMLPVLVGLAQGASPERQERRRLEAVLFRAAAMGEEGSAEAALRRARVQAELRSSAATEGQLCRYVQEGGQERSTYSSGAVLPEGRAGSCSLSALWAPWLGLPEAINADPWWSELKIAAEEDGRLRLIPQVEPRSPGWVSAELEERSGRLLAICRWDGAHELCWEARSPGPKWMGRPLPAVIAVMKDGQDVEMIELVSVDISGLPEGRRESGPGNLKWTAASP
jgi:hypothetical protein